MKTNGRIFICADLHGDAYVIKNIIDQIKNPSKEDIIIVAGDAGFEYGNYTMGAAKKMAQKFPGHWIVMRGNHDNCYMNDHQNDKGWSFIEDGVNTFIYQNKYPNIWYINDNGGIYNIKDFTFLFLPGAYSVDKYYRLRNNYPYNPNEQLDTTTMNELCDIVRSWNEKGFPIDYVVGHTFPKWLEPYYSDLFISGLDQSNIDKTTEQWLGVISEYFEDNPSFKMYYGGHFHSQKYMTDKYMMVYQNPIEIGTE